MQLPSGQSPAVEGGLEAARLSRSDRLRALRVRGRLRGRLRMSPTARVGRGVTISVAAEAQLVIGDGAELGDGCRVQVEAGTVEIAERVVVGEGCVIVAQAGVLIGPGCRLDDDVAVIDCARRFDDPEVPVRMQPLEAAPIRIDAGALLGARAVVLPGVHVGPGARVGPGAVVERDIPAGGYFAGAPAPRAVEDASGLKARRRKSKPGAFRRRR